MATTGTLTLWYDATTSSTVHLTSGKISQWDDRSSGGWNATEATAGQRPTVGASQNGNGTVQFTQGNHTQLDFGASAVITPAATGWTVWWGAELDVYDGTFYGFATLKKESGNATCWGYTSTGGYSDFYFGDSSASGAMGGIKPLLTIGTQTAWHIYVVDWDGSAYTATNESGAMTLGSGGGRACSGNSLGFDTNGWFGGRVMHFGAYNSKLGSTDKTSLITWLRAQVGI